MVASGPQILATSSLRRRGAAVQRHKLQAENLKRSNNRQQFNVLTFTPKMLYNPFALLSSCEQRLLRQSFVKVRNFVAQVNSTFRTAPHVSLPAIDGAGWTVEITSGFLF